MSDRRKKESGGGEDGSERWLITYADLVTLLFALFIVLFANSNLDEGKFGKTAESFRSAFDLGIGVLGGSSTSSGVFGEGGGNPIVTGLGTQAESDFQLISDTVTQLAVQRGLLEQVHVRTDSGQVVVSFSNNLLYAPASADINAQTLPFLREVGELLTEMPNEIRVEGHTDNIPVNSPAFPTNWELSTARATAVARYFVETMAIDPQRVSAAGFAEHRPVADNATPEGRARNRRADVVILYPQDLETPDALLDLGAEAGG